MMWRPKAYREFFALPGDEWKWHFRYSRLSMSAWSRST